MLENEWQNDPSKWVWGIFYYNPEDKRLLPPKRIAWMGWTVNWANPRSVLFMIVIFVLLGIFINILK